MERQQVLDEIQRRIATGGGHFVQTVKSMAEEMRVKPERLYYLIRSFEQKGELATISHGPNGMEFRGGTGEPRAAAASGAAPRRVGGARRSSGAVHRGGATGAANTSRFCPWCGKPVESQWRFCAACGEKVPGQR